MTCESVRQQRLRWSGRLIGGAARPTPGSVDLCLVSGVPLDEVQARPAELGGPVEQGPVGRTGATGPITSCYVRYVRDPDGNLIEISTYADAAASPIATG
ncbi:hypothetical protein [Frankia gtarii]|uniref:hypothetical protein n=1 Tax=Frankia gtarii TaxID=2950102 RepID=UPI0021C1EAF9|nr:hypothetical protein [Frankia gtarii]